MGRKKVLVYEERCNKCGAKPKINEEKSNQNWTVYNLDCACGGRIETDYDKPYYIQIGEKDVRTRV